MDIYVAPYQDEQYMLDLERLKGRDVRCCVMRLGHGPSVQYLVHALTKEGANRLVLPDDFHRHNELIEHVKCCAYHAGVEVMPLTRYLDKTTPPASAPVHAKPEAAGGVAHTSAAPNG